MGKHHNFLLLVWLITLLSACGGSNNDTPTPPVEPVNQAPVANAGDDISVDEQTPVTLTGQGTDSDGTVASYLWQQTAGTPVTLTNTDKAQASFTAPDIKTNETLAFSLTVTDNDGATHVDEVSIEVLHVNILPTANAGADIDADEETVVTLSGSASDEDGTITSYSWKQTAGTEATLKNADSSELAIALPDLPQDETFTFELTVTDNNGGTHTDTVDVKVKHLIWQTKSKNSGSLAELKAEFLDINSDDILDMLLEQSAEGNRTRIAWSKGKGDGSFEKPSTIARFTNELINSYSLEDIDNDGFKDLLVETKVEQSNSSTSKFYWNKIITNELYSEPYLITEVTSSEVNDFKYSYLGKSITDSTGFGLILVSDNDMYWFQRLNNGRFAEKASLLEGWSPIKQDQLSIDTDVLPGSWAFSDVTGDKLPDLVVSKALPLGGSLELSKYIQVAKNTGKGTFQKPQVLLDNHQLTSYFSSGGDASFSLEDINGDGTNDILLDIWSFDRPGQTTTTKWFSFKDEQLQESVIFSTQYLSYAGRSAKRIDWNEDGISDFILPIEQWSSWGINDLVVTLGQGNGIFSEPILVEEIQLSTRFFSINLDLDLDGKKDFIGYRSERYDNDDGTRSYKHFMFWHKKLVSNIEPAQDLFEYKGKIKGTYDINNDGHIDFVSELNGTLYWYQNQGDLTFVEKSLSLAQ